MANLLQVMTPPLRLVTTISTSRSRCVASAIDQFSAENEERHKNMQKADGHEAEYLDISLACSSFPPCKKI